VIGMVGNQARRGRILCLDGGGVRGLSSLLILKKTMEEAASQALVDPSAEPSTVKVARPYDYFDIIGGTSAGGLIALMLGRLGSVAPTNRLHLHSCLTDFPASGRASCA